MLVCVGDIIRKASTQVSKASEALEVARAWLEKELGVVEEDVDAGNFASWMLQ